MSASHKTKLPAPPASPRFIISFTLHSKFTGDSLILEGVIFSDLTSVNPPFWNSLTSAAKSHEVKETCWTISSVTRAITHSLI